MGKTLLITGASGGIGSQVAIQASRKGHICYITGRDEERLNETFDALSGEWHKVFVRDLTKNEPIIKEKIDSLIYCAGLVDPLPCKYIDNATYIKNIFDINFNIPVLMAGLMIRKDLFNPGASIIFISSEAVNSPYPGGSMLAASKAALEAYAKTLRIEQKQLTVHIVRPGMVATQMTNYVGIPPEDIAKQIINLL